jgi:hypothetical protein
MTLDEKRKAALEYLGNRHVLHPEYQGGVSHKPESVDVAKTVKRYNKRVADKQKAEQERLQSIMQNVRPIARTK